MNINDVIGIVRRVHDAEGMNFGGRSTRESRNADWARLIGIVHFGHLSGGPMKSVEFVRSDRQGSLSGPSTFQTIDDSSDRETFLSTPLHYRFGLALERNENRVSANAPICALLHTGGPSAVPWGIRAVVVATIDLMLWRWTPPHVFEKCLEGIPTITDCDPTATIVGKSIVRRIVAAITHRQPDTVFRLIRPPRRVSVLRRSGDENFFGEASAASSSSHEQMTGTHGDFVSACTPAPPVSLLAYIWRSAQDGPSRERNASEVFQWRHGASLESLAILQGVPA